MSWPSRSAIELEATLRIELHDDSVALGLRTLVHAIERTYPEPPPIWLRFFDARESFEALPYAPIAEAFLALGPDSEGAVFLKQHSACCAEGELRVFNSKPRAGERISFGPPDWVEHNAHAAAYNEAVRRWGTLLADELFRRIAGYETQRGLEFDPEPTHTTIEQRPDELLVRFERFGFVRHGGVRDGRVVVL